MASVKKRTVLALTVGVWLAAIGSATALTYELNRPLSPSATSSSTSSSTVTSSAVAPSDLPSATAPEGAQAQSVLYIPVITIVGQTPRRAPLEPKSFRDISKMNCADWRELDMGSGHVQICE